MNLSDVGYVCLSPPACLVYLPFVSPLLKSPLWNRLEKLPRSGTLSLLFLHEKDYWFKAIWQDIHLAATLDRVKSRDRPPVGLVRCICKDARSRGEEGTGTWTPVKLSVSNVHIFVPIWMIPDPVRHVRLLASQDIQPKTKGWVEYKEGWWVGGWGPRYLAWVRKDPKVVGGGFLTSLKSVDPFDLEP